MARGRKTGGRAKGAPNKVTADVRAAFRMLVESNTSQMQAWLEAVAKEDPAKALDLMVKLAEYVIPRLARTEFSGENLPRALLIIKG